MELARDFLRILREDGTPAERRLYARMQTAELITRLLTRRPLAFYNADDTFLLQDGRRGSAGDGFVAIGTAHERPPLLLRDYISYNELLVSSLLAVSVPTFFISDCSRTNRAELGAAGTFEAEGVVVEAVGCRFERPGHNEWRHMVVTREQNTAARGYGLDRTARFLALWARLYRLRGLPTFDEARALAARDAPSWPVVAPTGDPADNGVAPCLSAERNCPAGALLNVAAIRGRYRLHAVSFLSECSARGAEPPWRGSFCHQQEGFVLEPWWAISARQARWFLEGYREAIGALRLPGVRVINFAKFAAADFVAAFGAHPVARVVDADGRALEVRAEEREPAAALRGADAGLRLVYAFAGDPNAYPGNEYWLGGLDASEDPAAASCSLIPWLQNREVNPCGLNGVRTRVYGTKSRSGERDAASPALSARRDARAQDELFTRLLQAAAVLAPALAWCCVLVRRRYVRYRRVRDDPF